MFKVALITDYEVDNPHPLVGSNDHQFATSSSAPNGGSLVYGDVFPEMDERLFEVTERRSGADGRNDVVSSPWKQQSKKQRVLNVLEASLINLLNFCILQFFFIKRLRLVNFRMRHVGWFRVIRDSPDPTTRNLQRIQCGWRIRIGVL